MQIPNEQTGDKEWWWLPLSYGPYRYFRWREPDPEKGALKLHTWYFGKQEAAAPGDVTAPAEVGEEHPVDQPVQRKRPQRVLRPPRRTGEAPHGGRPAKLTPEEVADIEAWYAEHPQ